MFSPIEAIRDYSNQLAAGNFETLVEVPQMSTLLDGLQKVANRVFSGLVLAGVVVASALLFQYQRALGMIGFLFAGAIGLWMVATILISDRKK